MQMLQQYAELSGISFSTGFLSEFEDTVFGTNPTPSSQESSSSSNQTLEDEMDELLKAGLLQKEPFYVPPPVPTSSSAPLPSAEPFIPITVFESSYSPYQDPPCSTPPPPSSSTPPSPQLSVLHDSQASHPTGTPHFNIPQLYFESRFECGNLGKAIRRGPTQYELHCRNDVNTAGHTQWYFFQVKGLITRNEATYEDIVYRFDIVNMSKPKTLYTQGLRPLMYSEKRAETDGIGWFRCGNDIQYHETPAYLFTNDEPPSDPQQPPLPPKYTLSFTFKAIHQSDTVYFAHCYPYSYTTLQTDLQSMKTDPLRAPLFRHSILAKSVAGNNIDLLTITKPVTCPEDLVSRKGVILSARVHPGETNASWMMRGLLLWLTGASCEAEEVRRRFVVKVVPMINPDGVIVGNVRF
ncbi:Cytosolic carboxypeptidase 2 [Rhizoclosmatium hyalinum]|nr:Cytosolic carboxypeptidase 2 [Rhizoclosmatium hyalinum]